MVIGNKHTHTHTHTPTHIIPSVKAFGKNKLNTKTLTIIIMKNVVCELGTRCSGYKIILIQLMIN